MFRNIKLLDDERKFIVLKELKTHPSKPQRYEAVSRIVVGYDRADTIMKVAKQNNP